MQPVHSKIRTVEDLAKELGLFYGLTSVGEDSGHTEDGTEFSLGKVYFDPAGSPFRVLLDTPETGRHWVTLEHHGESALSLRGDETLRGSILLWLDPFEMWTGNQYGYLSGEFYAKLAEFDYRNQRLVSNALFERAPRSCRKLQAAVARIGQP